MSGLVCGSSTVSMAAIVDKLPGCEVHIVATPVPLTHHPDSVMRTDVEACPAPATARLESPGSDSDQSAVKTTADADGRYGWAVACALLFSFAVSWGTQCALGELWLNKL